MLLACVGTKNGSKLIKSEKKKRKIISHGHIKDFYRTLQEIPLVLFQDLWYTIENLFYQKGKITLNKIIVPTLIWCPSAALF